MEDTKMDYSEEFNPNDASEGGTMAADIDNDNSNSNSDNTSGNNHSHARTISWGKDVFYGEDGLAASTNTASATPSFTAVPSFAAAPTAPFPPLATVAEAPPTSPTEPVEVSQYVADPKKYAAPLAKSIMHQRYQAGTPPGASGEDSTSLTPEPDTSKNTIRRSYQDIEDENARQAAYLQNLFAGAPPQRSTNKGWHRDHVSSLGNIDLSDVLREAPFEHEAETYILRAIEARDPTPLGGNSQHGGTAGVHSGSAHHQHETTASSTTIFPQIPDDAIDDAISALSQEEDNTATDKGDAPSNTHTSLTPPPSAAGTGASSQRLKSLNFGASTKARSPKPNFHRRKQTMEQQLCGLTEAFHAMDDFNWNDSVLAAEPLMEGPGVPQFHDTAAGALTRDASILYNRGNRRKISLFDGNNKQKSNDEEKLADATGKGGFLTKSLLVYKKTDGDATTNSERLGETSKKFEAGLSESEGAAGPLSTSSHMSNDLRDIEEGVGESNSEDGKNKKDEENDEKNDTNDTNEDDDEEYNEGTHADASTFQRENKTKEIQKQAGNAVRELQDFFEPQKKTIGLYLRVVFLYIAGPLLGIAAILFYAAGCPPTGRLDNGGYPTVDGTLRNIDGQIVSPNQTSYSWWLLFVVRQLVTLTLAFLVEKICVEFLTIRSRGTINLLGPWVTLFVLQSRGWPSTITVWAILDMCLLQGSYSFAHHWMYWQAGIGLVNFENPSGGVVTSDYYVRILIIALVLGIVTSFKRMLLGMYLGKRTFSAYADQLTNVMKKILLVREVAALARDFEREMRIRATRKGVSGPVHLAQMSAQRQKLFDIFHEIDEEREDFNTDGSVFGPGSNYSAADTRGKVDYVIDPDDRNPWSGGLSYAQQQRIIKLLGDWEEPTIAERQIEVISVSSLLQFRRSMACMNIPAIFGGAFGMTDSRERCIESAQEVYGRLMLNDLDQAELNFETLALLGLKRDGTLDHSKLKDLIRLFRPDRDGSLGVLDFVKSVDSVYKEVRLLRASVNNTSKIDKSFESIVNWFYYTIAFVIILGQLGYSPMSLFLSISGVILAFAFMIGSASSKYFEGLLFILVRRPYNIGDGIHVMGIETEGMYSGHPFWYVEDVSLFTTTVMYMYTGERATLSNGSLANSRIINSTRSPQAWMYTLLKFPVDVSHEKIQIFNTALEQFFRNRPREWRSYDSFRATRLDAEAGFIEYMVVCTHRMSWYEWKTVHVSKADMIHFCMELSKQLGIFYRTPPMPVDLTIKGPSPLDTLPLPYTPHLEGASAAGPDAPTSSTRGLDPMSPMTRSVGREQDFSALQSMFPPRMG